MSTTAVGPVTGPADLFDFAWLPARGADVPAPKAFESRLRELAERAQPETWSFDPAQPFSILSNYLRYTFKRLAQQGKIEEGEDSHGSRVAAFNTGLFTPNYEAIYAFFEANRDKSRQPWVLKDFVAECDRRMAFFERRPAVARYFDNPAELIYDPDRELIPNLDHIVDDNVDRYPADLRDSAHRRRMMLQGQVVEAGKRAQMNYKVAVPQFYFGRDGAEPGRIQLLLPLCFESPARADLALVVEREARAYRAFTVLPLDLAYKNARLIARPESDWLPKTCRVPQAAAGNDRLPVPSLPTRSPDGASDTDLMAGGDAVVQRFVRRTRCRSRPLASPPPCCSRSVSSMSRLAAMPSASASRAIVVIVTATSPRSIRPW
jgi:hypothetical protein